MQCQRLIALLCISGLRYLAPPGSLFSCVMDLDIRKCKEQLLVVHRVAPFPRLTPSLSQCFWGAQLL